ncbi:LOW QUALITY PROTEIN: hypothetical protein NC653_028950 [Populus alba x Populus x berolinensis]|uniref:Uncharacterized protein n=1 Tax=Populus alba x Populus x berolinensis TaxID=444605 RepID=A0AAD6M184_9ROSI|nr:LOW QUALITY PROTEIN: hypothetical protein NC653_028950 [Populus alba x Populus x berolinensis]
MCGSCNNSTNSDRWSGFWERKSSREAWSRACIVERITGRTIQISSGSGLLAVEVIDDTVEAEVDGTDPNLKIDEAVKKSVDAETEKFLFPSEFSIAKAVVAALMLLLATLLAEALDHEF